MAPCQEIIGLIQSLSIQFDLSARIVIVINADSFFRDTDENLCKCLKNNNSYHSNTFTFLKRHYLFSSITVLAI